MSIIVLNLRDNYQILSSSLKVWFILNECIVGVLDDEAIAIAIREGYLCQMTFIKVYGAYATNLVQLSMKGSMQEVWHHQL